MPRVFIKTAGLAPPKSRLVDADEKADGDERVHREGKGNGDRHYHDRADAGNCADDLPDRDAKDHEGKVAEAQPIGEAREDRLDGRHSRRVGARDECSCASATVPI